MWYSVYRSEFPANRYCARLYGVMSSMDTFLPSQSQINAVPSAHLLIYSASDKSIFFYLVRSTHTLSR